jgi:histidyl-tRNA synthetase
MFRHERPQRGRHRQFHQLGVEVFGAAGPDIDAELIALGARIWRVAGIRDLRLELNSLGDDAARAAYREALLAHFGRHRGVLDADSRERLERNPLRILDSKNPDMRPLIDAAPLLCDYLDDGARAHFDGLCAALGDQGIDFVVNPRLVRGLDYYSRTVFEWVTDDLGAQGTVCAGGRYDGVVELMGGRPTPAIGFAMGLERVLELGAQHGARVALPVPALYVCATGEHLESAALALAEDLRDRFPRWVVLSHVGGGSLKSRMKRADRSGASLALILGDEEQAADAVTVRPLRGGASQSRCPRAELATLLPRLVSVAGAGDG